MEDLAAYHRMTELLGHLDVGVLVLDRDCRVQFWNAFMENHSGLPRHRAEGRSLFEIFPEVDADWLKRKLESVFVLNNRAFTIWEQRPWIFPFQNYRPVTGQVDRMYQNTSMIPLVGLDAEVSHVALIVYDVTDVAVGRQALTAANAALELASRTDALTGLDNRGHWEECLNAEFRRCRRTGQPATLVMFDVDHFKKVNDTHGHPAGDAVLRNVARVLTRTLRETDRAGRYGGEEFGVILVNADAVAAGYFAERLRKAMEAARVTHGGAEIACTISLGMAALDAATADPKDWIERADAALYHSKSTGRNRASVYSDAFGAAAPGPA